VIALPLALGLLLAQEVPRLAGRTLAEWRERIEPAAEELVWAEIPWRPTFLEAVEEARTARKPVLLWAMIGHPLGCT
jgi:hypothetical protein